MRLGYVIAGLAMGWCWSATGGGALARNPPPECAAENGECGCGEEEVSDGCIKVSIDMGRTTPWTGGERCALKVFADNRSPRVFTPESLHAVAGGYSFKRVGNAVLGDGETPREVVFSHPRGEPVHFVFRDGEAEALPDPGFHVKMDERLLMTDAQGWACTVRPTYYDLHEADGTVRRFLATDATGERGRLVHVRDWRGRVATAADMGVDAVYGADGVRQFLTPCRLADVRTREDGYDVAVYAVGEAPRKNPATGLYALPGDAAEEVFTVRGCDGGDRVEVTVTKGGGEGRRHVFEWVRGDWSLRRPDGVEERRERMVEDSRRARTARETYSRDGALLRREEHNYAWREWGFAPTNSVEGFGGAVRRTEREHIAGGDGRGRVKSEMGPTGLRTEYFHDVKGRVVRARRTGPGMQEEEIEYGYEPVDEADEKLPCDMRPRTVVRKLGGVECGRTYYSHAALTNVVERAGEQGATYGGKNALRTVTAFYPTVEGDVRSGRVAMVRREDGRIERYGYKLAGGMWEETVTHLHELAPEPASGKTLREARLTNARCEEKERRTEVYIGGEWHVVARERMEHDARGRVVRREDLSGQAERTEWDCCRRISRIASDGSATAWEHDGAGREIAVWRLVPTDATNSTWVAECREHDGMGRETAVWATNHAERTGLPAIRTRYDALGRVVARTDRSGAETRVGYGTDGRSETRVNPDGGRVTTVRNAAGETISVTGSGAAPEFRTYGTLADGTRWTRTVTGDSPEAVRFETTYRNMLGQTVRKERSGFRGAVIGTDISHDGYGRQVCIEEDGAPRVEHFYDEYGELAATVRSVGLSGGGREWRKEAVRTAYLQTGGEIWHKETKTTTCSDAAIAPLTTERRVQLTGLTVRIPFRAQTVDARGNVSEFRAEYDGGATIEKRYDPWATNGSVRVLRHGVAVETVSASAVTNRIQYDALGRELVRTDGRGNAERREYDAQGRQSAARDGAGNAKFYSYDLCGRPVAVADGTGNAAVYAYDARGLKTYEGGAEHPAAYLHDAQGNITQMTTYRDEAAGAGDTTLWRYDEGSGCMTNKVDANGMAVKCEYDARGRATRRIWARGVETEYGYDAWGNLTSVEHSDGTPRVEAAYDTLGRLTRLDGAGGCTFFRYDDFGAVTNETTIGAGWTNSLERFRDKYGREAGYALNGERQTELRYDAATGRIAEMHVAGSGKPFRWRYEPGSDLKAEVDYPNGMRVFRKYGGRGELTETRIVAGGREVSRHRYAYDASGRVCRREATGDAEPEEWVYMRNARGELTNAVDECGGPDRYSYRYDDAGNRKTSFERGSGVAYAANALNQYATAGSFSPEHDEDGNQTLVKTGTGVWRVEYDGANRPARWISGGRTLEMAYDLMGRRVSKGGIRYAYDGFRQVADSAGNRYVWDPTEPEAPTPLVWRRGVENFHYLHDGRRNVTGIVAEDGNMAARYRYAPFGETVSKSGGYADANPWRHSSGHADGEIGVTYYNYRHYEPLSGRWLSRDPIYENGGINLYVYCGNGRADYDALGLFGDGYVEECVRGHWICNPAVSGVRWEWVCMETIRRVADYKGHFQFANNGTKCEFDYTKEDHKFTTSPWAPWGIYRHFRSRESILSNIRESKSELRDIASGKIGEAISKCNPDAFESHMHQLQDTWTHYDRGWRWWTMGHLFGGTDPDRDIKAQTTLWEAAQKATLKYVSQWNANCRLKDECKCEWERR